ASSTPRGSTTPARAACGPRRWSSCRCGPHPPSPADGRAPRGALWAASPGPAYNAAVTDALVAAAVLLALVALVLAGIALAAARAAAAAARALLTGAAGTASRLSAPADPVSAASGAAAATDPSVLVRLGPLESR